jgi:hypothetical protein
MARAVLTAAGTNRFEQLCQAALGISAAQFMTSCPWVDDPVLPRRTMTPAGRRLSTSAPLRAPGGQPDPSPADLGSTR